MRKICHFESEIQRKRLVVLRRTSRLERKLKFSYNSNLNTNVSHKGLYTMDQNTKKPNTTKGPIKPKQKHYKNYRKVFIPLSEANLRSL